MGQFLGYTLAEVSFFIEWNGAEEVLTVHDHDTDNRVLKEFHVDACFSNRWKFGSFDHIQSDAQEERDVSQVYQVACEGLEICDFYS